MSLFRTLFASSLFILLAGCDSSSNNGVPPLSVAQDLSFTEANDLRGLSYAADGKIYASGHQSGADDQVVVARFNPDGSPDQTFGGDGFVTINVAVGSPEESLGVVELANGDVIVLVNAGDGNGGQMITADDNPAVMNPREEGVSAVLLRLDGSGAPVTSFGNNGRAEVVFGWADADNGDWPVPTLDSVDGFSHAGFPQDTAFDLQRDDSAATERVVVFGFGPAPRETGGGSQRLDRDRYVARIDAATGQADSTFNGGEAFVWNSPNSLTDNARRGNVEADGRIVSAGYTNLGSGLGNHIILIRLDPTGALDASFTGFGQSPNEAGVAVFNPFLVDGGFAEAYAAGRLSNGDYVTTGYGGATGSGTPSTLGYLTTQAQDLVTFRVANGTLDTSFGNVGTQAIQSESQGRASAEDRGRDMVVLADDSTVQVGRFGGTPAIYAFTPDGQLDTRVDDDGIIELSHPSIGQQFFAVALSDDGQQLAVTTSTDAAGARLVLVDVSQ